MLEGNMKKIATLVAAVALATTLTACGADNSADHDKCVTEFNTLAAKIAVVNTGEIPDLQFDPDIQSMISDQCSAADNDAAVAFSTWMTDMSHDAVGS